MYRLFHQLNPYNTLIMKMRLILFVTSIAALMSVNSFGQTNTFPGTGNVGIGTTSPSFPLDVNGSINAISYKFRIYGSGINEESSRLYIAPIGDRLDILNKAGNKFVAIFDGTNSLHTFYNSGSNSTIKLNTQISRISGSGDNAYLELYHNLNGNITLMNKASSLLYGNILFGTNSTEKMRITTDGNVGVGVTAPSEKFEVNGNIKASGLILPSGAGAGKVLTSNASGEATWQTATATASDGWSFDGNTVGVLKKFGTTNNYDLPIIANNIECMRVLTNGSVVIGTTIRPAADAKLAVDGFIYSRKVKVTNTGWADYVFAPSYKLPSLSEVEAFIKKNQHLPDIPSAAEVAKNGLDLGDNQVALLKKIEELTLYLIEIKKENEQMRKEIKALQKKN